MRCSINKLNFPFIELLGFTWNRGETGVCVIRVSFFRWRSVFGSRGHHAGLAAEAIRVLYAYRVDRYTEAAFT